MMRTFFALLGCCGLFLPANAANMTFQFSGIVTDVPVDDIYGDIAVGDLIQGSYTFGPRPYPPPDDPFFESVLYFWVGAPFGMTVTISGHVFSLPGPQDPADSTELYIVIGDENIGGRQRDIYQVVAQPLTAPSQLYIVLTLDDNTGTAFSSLDLPLSAPPLSAFDVKAFLLDQLSSAGAVRIGGQITCLSSTSGCVDQVVPEPSTWALALAGLAFAGLSGRHYFKLRPASR